MRQHRRRQFIVVTATPDPALGQAVTIAQPTPIQAASNEIVSVQVQPAAVPTDLPAIPATPVPTDSVPEVLILIRSLSVSIPGGTITMGTTPVEVTEAVNDCTRDGGFCEASFAFDSYPAHEVTVDSFLMEITEVTFDQYVAFLNVRGPDTHINGCAGFPCIQTQNESRTPLSYTMAQITVSAPDCGRTRSTASLITERWNIARGSAGACLPRRNGNVPPAPMTIGFILGETAGTML